MIRFAPAALVCAALLAGPPPSRAAAPACAVPLVDPSIPLEEVWDRHHFDGESRFGRAEAADGTPVIRAVADGASGLWLPVDRDIRSTPVAEWRWMAEVMQADADLRRTEAEDFSAVIFFVFGKPSLFRRSVPTLAYALTATPVPDGSMIPSPRHPDTRVTIKLGGLEAAGQWRMESRDLLADYRAAFGRDPEENLRYVAIFADNDQTEQMASALYGPVFLMPRASTC